MPYSENAQHVRPDAKCGLFPRSSPPLFPESAFSNRFTPYEYPRQRHRDSHLIRKHFLKRGCWYVSDRISRKEKRAIAIVVNQAHAFIHKLILANGAMAHLAVNANIEHGTAWDVD